MPEKVFIYSADVANKDVRDYFRKKGYASTGLTRTNVAFWRAVNSVDQGGRLVIYSHGNDHGPLMVAGNAGPDMTHQQVRTLGTRLNANRITLYLLSCHTGQDPFHTMLADTGCSFVAPVGYALARAGAAGVSFFSVKSMTGPPAYEGWTGTHALVPDRKSKALNIP